MLNSFSHITLVVSEECNLCCEYCFESHARSSKIMDDEVFERSLKLLISTKGKKSITFFGGEPLVCWEKIKQWIEKVKLYYPNVGMSITTNGILLTQEIYWFLGKNNVKLLMSIDGFGGQANIQRRDKNNRGIWENWFAKVSSIDKQYRKMIKIRMTLTPDNVCYLSYSVRKFVEFGINDLAFAINYDAAWRREDIEVYKEEFMKVLGMVKDGIYNRHRIHIDIIDRIFASGIHKVYTRCRYVLDSLTVMPDGDLKNCHREKEKRISIFAPEKEIANVLADALVHKYGMENCRECALYKRCVFCQSVLRNASERQKDLICEINRFHIIETDKLISHLYNEKISIS